MSALDRPVRRTYLPGIDGLRAVSVLAVIGYHLDLPFLRGGFLGVDTFFVISGFLITDLLLREVRDHGRISLRDFWIRRARRLFPALWLVLIAVATASVIVGGDFAAGLRGNTIAALAYVSNWWQIATDASYFAEFGPPPPLLHLWSLAVEEQFYVVWPLLLIGFLWLLRKRALFAVAALALAVGSAALMWTTFQPGADPSRAYYGTDSHAFGLLFGATLAAAVGAKRLQRLGPVVATVLGILGLSGMVICYVAIGAQSTVAFHGGIVAASLLACAAIAAAAAPGAFSIALGIRPLRWLGVRSYGLYLWHWPVIAVTAAAWPSMADVWWVKAGEFALAVALAALSWRFVERPVQQRGILPSLLDLGRGLVSRNGRLTQRLAGVFLASAAAFAVVACVLAPSQTGLQQQLAQGREQVEHAGHRPPPAPEPAPPKPGQPPPPQGQQMTAIGDSVMLASASSLTQELPGIDINAEDDRSMVPVPEIISGYEQRGQLRDTVVVGVADNGGVDQQAIDEVIAAAGPKRQVVFINTALEDGIGSEANQLLEQAARRHNVKIADWSSYAHAHPGQLLPDAIHPNPTGAKAYARIVERTAAAPS